MKKRLLSAALAFAMVLTLLPASMLTAGAVDYQKPSPADPSTVVKSYDKDGNPTYYYTVTPNANNPGAPTINTVTVALCTQSDSATGREYGNWYWLDNRDSANPQYHSVSTGFVVGVGGSGLWYKDLKDFMTYTTNSTTGVKTYSLRNTSFTILDNAVDLSAVATGTDVWNSNSLTVDFWGDVTLTVPQTLTSLTATSKYRSAPTGTVAGLNIDRSAYGSPTSGVSVTATNVKFDSINLTGRANTVKLTGCAVANSITMNGETYTTQAAQDARTANAWNAQKLTTATNTATGKATTIGGSVTITNSDNGAVAIADSTVTGTVSVEGNGGSIAVSGNSNTGAVSSQVRTKTGTWPSITVSGGTVASVTQTSVADATGAITVNVSGTYTTVNGPITISGGSTNNNITITSANVSNVTVPAGKLTFAGNNAQVGTVTLGKTDTVTLSVTATNSKFTGIQAATDDKGNNKGTNIVISSWNGNRYQVNTGDTGNNYGVLDLGNYSGKKVTGGTFSNLTNFKVTDSLYWLDSSLQFYVKPTGSANVYNLYTKNELARAISDIGTANAKVSGAITVLGQNGDADITLMNGSVVWAKIGYDIITPLILPTSINNVTISNWIYESGASVAAGTEQAILFAPSGVKLNATATSPEVTKITNATVSIGNNVENKYVKVTMSGNNIALSGAVDAVASGLAVINLDLETDAVDDEGDPIIIRNVPVVYNTSNKTITFTVDQNGALAGAGVIVQDGALVLGLGTGARYTVSGSLTTSASNLGLMDEGDIEVTVNINGWTTEQKNKLINDLTTGASVSFAGNVAVQEAINAAQATITSTTTVDNWISTAKTNVWRNGYKEPGKTNYYEITDDSVVLVPHTGNFSASTKDGESIANAFGVAYLVPYLQMNVTAYSTDGTLTATLTPYYRVDVSGVNGYNPDLFYTVQTGRTLGTLTGDMSNPITVTLGSVKLASEMHQDGKYVYTGASNTWKIYHAGVNGGLGTVVINGITAPITMSSTIKGRKPAANVMGYDTLQAAIDDTQPGATAVNTAAVPGDNTWDTVIIDGSYNGSCAITMTGAPRTIVVVANGSQDVTTTAPQYVTVQTSDGHNYTLKLTAAPAAAATVDIVVETSNYGVAVPSVTKATAGQVVTVTTAPSTGYMTSALTVVTNTNAAVKVTTNATNQYSFTVPENVTKITITPVFVAGDTRATISVANVSGGSAVTSAVANSNKAEQGSVVTVTTIPNSSSYRTMGLTARTNTGATVTATRTGTNTFSVVVPAGATTVTVTPSFDVNNGTPFTDVLASHWSSDAIAWCYRNKYVEGTGTYTFSPTAYTSRGELLVMLWKAEGSPIVNVSNPFSDITSTNYWGYNAIMWAVSKGLIDTSAGAFAPYSYITRADAVLILYKRAGSPTVYGTSGFVDVPATSVYANAVTWAKQQGLTLGYSGSTYFRPGYAITRQEIAAFLYRAFA